MNLTVSEIAAATGSSCPAGTEDVVVTGFAWDSRSVVPGDLYIALEGERVDGHDFADSAVDAGAVAVLASRPVTAVAPIIIVDDVMGAFADLAAYWRDRMVGTTVIGLTGSSGKTTTKNLVRDVLAHDKVVIATKANQNNELGVPATILAAGQRADAVVVEMGMRGRGQIARLAEIARPDWGLITNVGTSHIELLGSRDEIARAKSELFEALPDGHGVAFVNMDEDYAVKMCVWGRLEERGVQVVCFSAHGSMDSPVAHTPGRDLADEADSADESDSAAIRAILESAPRVWASDVSLDGDGRPTFTLNAVGFGQLGLEEAHGSQACTLNLLGLHNVSNACAAVAVGLASGMSLSACCEALEGSAPEKGRQVIHRTPGAVTVIDDAYNANPDSMSASLTTFAALDVSGKRIAVLGDMLELGDYARASHEEAGSLAARSNLDVLVCVGELAGYMASAARAAGMPDDAVIECADAAAAIEAIEGRVAAGDAVLVKASHSVGLDHVVERLVM